jgi:hypothetical protein
MPAFHPTFLVGLVTLTEEFDEEVYRTFIDAFGMHFVQKGFMGALYGEKSIISSKARESFKSMNLDIQAAASTSAFGISASASLQVESGKFRRQDVQRSVYSHGAPSPSDGEPTTWAQLTIDSPAPIYTEFKRLDNISRKLWIHPALLLCRRRVLFAPAMHQQQLATNSHHCPFQILLAFFVRIIHWFHLCGDAVAVATKIRALRLEPALLQLTNASSLRLWTLVAFNSSNEHSLNLSPH